MGAVYETEDDRRRNLAGIGYGLMKGDLKPEDVGPGPEPGCIVLRGEIYRRVG